MEGKVKGIDESPVLLHLKALDSAMRSRDDICCQSNDYCLPIIKYGIVVRFGCIKYEDRYDKMFHHGT